MKSLRALPRRQGPEAQGRGAALVEAPGSLSARLRSLGTRFEVEVLHEGIGRLGRDERRDLGVPTQGQGWVRVVLLRVDGQACVLARSVCPRTSSRSAWRAIRALGPRPLADVLYAGPALRRSPLNAFCLRPRDPWRVRLERQVGMTANPGIWPPGSCWGRHSTFFRKGQALRVMEIFLRLPLRSPGGPTPPSR